MLGGLAVVLVFIIVMVVTCSCCRLCARQQQEQSRQRARVAARQRVDMDHFVVAVIPSSLSGQSTPPLRDFNYWGPPPPPYTSVASPVDVVNSSEQLPTSSNLPRHLQTTSAPPYYELPPPYN